MGPSLLQTDILCEILIMPIRLSYRVLGKNCVFHNPLQPIPRLHIVAKDLLCLTQCECTVTLIGWLFSVQAVQPSAGEGEIAEF